MGYIATVGRLRELLQDLPSEMPVEVWSGSVESPVYADAGVCESDCDGSVVFQIRTEN